MAGNNAINRNEINLVKTTIFTASGTFTPSGIGHTFDVEIVGGGGSGGGSATSSVGNIVASASGGGGGYCFKQYNTTEMGASAAIVIGAGGAGSTAGAVNGNNGGSSTFTPAGTGAVLTANGGGLGVTQAVSAIAKQSLGGVGGTATGGDINISGQTPADSFTTITATAIAIGAPGGSSKLGIGAPANNVAVTGTGSLGLFPVGYGSGSAGCASIDDATAFGSIPGQDGVCIVREYYNL